MLSLLGVGCRALRCRIPRVRHRHSVVSIRRHFIRNDGDEDRFGAPNCVSGHAAGRKHLFANPSRSHHRCCAANVHRSFRSGLCSDHGIHRVGVHRGFWCGARQQHRAGDAPDRDVLCRIIRQNGHRRSIFNHGPRTHRESRRRPSSLEPLVPGVRALHANHGFHCLASHAVVLSPGKTCALGRGPLCP